MTHDTQTLEDYIGVVGTVQESQDTIEEVDEERDTAATSTSVVVERAEKQRVAEDVEEWVSDARRLARDLGLDPYHVNYWVVGNDEMNELITYEGFQRRYPHWRWGMQYDQQRKKGRFTGGKVFEIVNNDDPAHAFLQVSNSEADQKAVVTHVEAHADFFANNQWFRDDPNAATMLSHHAERIEDIMSDPDVSRDDVEWLIDTILCIRDHIDQTQTLLEADPLQQEDGEITRESLENVQDRVDDLDIPDSMKEQLFDEEWVEEHSSDEDRTFNDDLLAYFLRHGSRYDEDSEEARDFEDWELEIIRMLREESYYMAPQRMTKVMNEGWASFWETAMMAWEGFAGDDEFIEYADHHSKVLEAPGLNPYELGRSLWMYIENQTNRREVVDKILRVRGITPQNFHEEVDFDAVREELDHPESYSPARRNFSLTRPENRGFIEQIDFEELKEIYRYIVDYDKYDSMSTALDSVDYEAGWKRMREIRETHVDVTFIDEFMDEEFIEDRNFFVWDHNDRNGRREVSSIDPEDVKKKVLLEFTNFGKPSVVVEDGNYNNTGELLLTHQYNGIPLDVERAGDVIQRSVSIWGRPVHLRTIDRHPDGSELPIELSYEPGGDDVVVRELSVGEAEYLFPDSDIDNYWTKPNQWFE